MSKTMDVAVGFLLVGLVAILDIAVIALILNPLAPILTSDQYNTAATIWHIALVVFSIGAALLFWVLLGRPIIALWFAGLGVGGWEDAFYFWFQGQAIPDVLPWLPHYSTSTILYAAMAGSFIILYTITRRLR